MKTFFTVLLGAVLSLTGLTWAQGDSLFVNLQGVKTDQRGDMDLADEKTFDAIRLGQTDDEKVELKRQKGTQYELMYDLSKDEKWEEMLLEIKKYFEIIRQTYAPGEYGYRDVMSEVFFLTANCFLKMQVYVEAVRHYQRVLEQFKDTRYALKSAIEWSRIFFKLYTGEIKAPGLPVPDKNLLLKRLLFVKTIAPDQEEVAEGYLMAADVCIREKDYDEARKFLTLIKNEFPRSDAADKVEARRALMK